MTEQPSHVLRDAAELIPGSQTTLSQLQLVRTRRDQRRRVVTVGFSLILLTLGFVGAWAAFRPTGGAQLGAPDPGGQQASHNGPIAFIVGPAGPNGGISNPRISVVEPNGTDYRTLVPGPDAVLGGLRAWSPDGRLLAYDKPSPGSEPDSFFRQLWIVDPSGGEPKHITDGAHMDSFMDWSPDSRSALILRVFPDEKYVPVGKFGSGAPRMIVRIDIETGEVSPITPLDGYASYARWAPNGNRIAVIEEGPEGAALVTATPDGSGRTVVARAESIEGIEWSANGDLLYRAGGSRIMRFDGLRTTELTTLDNAYPTPSPDGTQLAWLGWVGDEPGGLLDLHGVVVANADGSEARTVTGAPVDSDTVTWAPGGNRIAFTRAGDLWTVDVATGQETQLTHTEEREYMPAWGARNTPS